MEDTNDGDPVRCLTVKQQMRPNRKLAVARSNFIAFASLERVGCYDRNGRLEFSDVTLGLIVAPLLGAVFPDFAEIGLGAR
jgi:hypothetical protein